MSKAVRILISFAISVFLFTLFTFCVIVFTTLYQTESDGYALKVLLFLWLALSIAVAAGIFVNEKLKHDEAHPEIAEKKRAERQKKLAEKNAALQVKNAEKEQKREVFVQNHPVLSDFLNVNNEIKAQLQLVGGIGSLPTGTSCYVAYNYQRMKFFASGQEFTLDVSKLVDVSVMTQSQVQQQYVSSVGGAVAGAVLFGPIGAIIGGKATKKKVRQSTLYLILTYLSGGTTSYIVFDVTANPYPGYNMQRNFRYLKKNPTIKVEL